LHSFFRQVIAQRDFIIPEGIIRDFSGEELYYLGTLYAAFVQSDTKIIDKAAVKGYTVKAGVTLSLKEFVNIAAQTVYCPISKGLFYSLTIVPIRFDMSSPGNAPFVLSLNRRQGFDGVRTSPTHKYLHTLQNVCGCSRAVNLGENCYGTEAVRQWIGFISGQDRARYL